MNKKHIITAFVAGILLTIFAYHAYTVYTFRSAINAQARLIQEQGVALSQVIEFLNKATAQTPQGGK